MYSGFFFIPDSSLKVCDHSIYSKRRKIYLGESIQALQMTHYHIMTIQFQSHPGIQWHTFNKIMFVFINSCSYKAKFKGSRLFMYLNHYRAQRLPATKYKPKLLHGLTRYFILVSLHWRAKQRNRTSVLLG